MEVKSTGISAKLNDQDVRQAIVDFMNKHGYEINECDISFTMGRKPKALSCSIETGVSGNSEDPVDSQVEEQPTAVDAKEALQEEESTETEAPAQGSIFGSTEKEDPMMAAADPDLDTSSDNQQTTSIFG